MLHVIFHHRKSSGQYLELSLDTNHTIDKIGTLTMEHSLYLLSGGGIRVWELRIGTYTQIGVSAATTFSCSLLVLRVLRRAVL